MKHYIDITNQTIKIIDDVIIVMINSKYDY